MELLDSNWEYYVNNNTLYNNHTQLNKLDRSKVFELAKFDLTKLFEICDQLDINSSKLLRKLNFQQLKSKIINKLKELKIDYEIKNYKDQDEFYIQPNLTIIIKSRFDELDNHINEELETLEYEPINYVQYIIWNNDKKSSDFISINEYSIQTSFIAKDEYKDRIFTHFDIPANPKERFLEQNYWKFNIKPPKYLKWHETF